MGILFLCFILVGKHSAFHLYYNVTCGVFLDFLYQIEEVPFYFWFMDCLIMKRCGISSHAFSASMGIFMCFFILYSVDTVYYIN